MATAIAARKAKQSSKAADEYHVAMLSSFPTVNIGTNPLKLPRPKLALATCTATLASVKKSAIRTRTWVIHFAGMLSASVGA